MEDFKGFTPLLMFDVLSEIYNEYIKKEIYDIYDTQVKNLLNETIVPKRYNCMHMCKFLTHIYDYTFSQTDDLSFNNLGFMYFYGLGITKNMEKGLTLLKVSAELNNVYAMRNLGVMYSKNEDFCEAEKYFLKGIELGDIVCMNDLGVLYRRHNNNDKAVKYYMKAIEQGFYTSNYNLAILYFNTNEYEKALVLFQELVQLRDNNELSESLSKKDYVEFVNRCTVKLIKLTTLYCNIQEDNCTCCLDPLMNTNKTIITLLCGHSFHYSCTKTCKVCPICRHEIEHN